MLRVVGVLVGLGVAVGVLGVLGVVVVCGVVCLVRLVRGGLICLGLVGLGLVAAARRIVGVVCLVVGGVVLRLRVGVLLGGLAVGVLGVLGVVVVCGVVCLVRLVRGGLICLALVGLGLVAAVRRISSVVGLAVGRVILRLRIGVRVLGRIVVGLGVGVGLAVLGGVLVVGVLGVLVAVVVCGVVFLVGLVRRGFVGLGLVTVARRVSGVVGLAVGGVVLRLRIGVCALGRILVGLVRVGLVLIGLAVGVVFLVGLIRRGLVRLVFRGLGLVAVARRISGVVGLTVGGVVLRLGVSVRALAGIVPLLSVGISLTGAICVPGAVASLPCVCGLVRVGGGRVCCRPSTVRLLVGAAQGFFEGEVLLRSGGCVGGAVSTLSYLGGCRRGRRWNQRVKRRACRRWKCRSARCGPMASALRSLSIGRTSGDLSVRCRRPRC
ncbi:hypothetical protein [Actinomyces sp. oral taxon 180]|uniref:hypothetical protein n=1 Tax=Actinomyces sp. oral taxon 180 TaxID=651609 RepID=UPI0012E9A86F|nr:hypothetical protein [Actinomyces sp. oral taxon 180]